MLRWDFRAARERGDYRNAGSQAFAISLLLAGAA